jgi:hypothetical protein
MPKKPTAEQLNAIFEMFEASLEGELYDPEKWAKYYRPWGLEFEGAGNTETTTEEKSEKSAKSANVERVANISVEKAEEETVAEESPNANASTSSASAQDILAKIRQRNS